MVVPFSPSPNHSPVKIDLTRLNMLSESDPGFKDQILQMLQIQADEVANELQIRYQKGDWRGVADTAHRFKSAVNIINQQAYSHFMNLEKEARENESLDTVKALVEEGISMCSRLSSQISELLLQK